MNKMGKKVLVYISLVALMLFAVVVSGDDINILYLGGFIIFACGGINIAICDSLNIVKLGMGVTRYHQHKMVLKHFYNETMFSVVFIVLLVTFSLLVNHEYTLKIMEPIMLYMTTILIFQITLMIFNTQYWPTTILFIIAITIIIAITVIVEINATLLFDFPQLILSGFSAVLSIVFAFINKVLYGRDLLISKND